MGVIAFCGPEIGKVIRDRFFCPGVVESLARETLIHLSHDRVEAFWVASGRIVHYRVPIELRVSMRDPVRVHEFHALDEENMRSTTVKRDGKKLVTSNT